MGDVIQFPTRDKEDEAIHMLLKISDEIDEVILRHIDSGEVDPKDVAGLLAHRLGTLMRSVDEKTKLWDVCEKVLKRQAAID